MEHHDQAGNFSLYLRQKYWHVEVTYYVSEIWRDEQTQIISCVVVVINGVNKTKTITAARSQSQSLVMLNVLCLFILYSSTIYLDKKLFTDFLHLMHSHNTTFFMVFQILRLLRTHICEHIIKYLSAGIQEYISDTIHLF